MKKYALLTFLCFSLAITCHAQFKIGLKGGLSSPDIDPKAFIITRDNATSDLKVDIENAGFGYHLGIFTRITIANVFIQPELIYNSSSVDYKLSEIELSNTISSIKEEKFKQLDIPVIAGLKWSPMRVGAGPVGHIHLNNTSGLFDIDGYAEDFKMITFGWQAGLGLDLWSLIVDLRYEGNFNNFGDHIVIGGESFDFSDRDNRIVLSAGISF